MNKINKKGEMDLGGLTMGQIVVFFIGVIVILALIPQIYNTQAEMTTKQTFENDSVTYAGTEAEGQINASYSMDLAKAQTGWRENECPITLSSVTNNNGTALTENTDYTFTGSTGNFSLLNTYTANWTLSNGNNLTLINGTYCKEGYNTGSGARGIAGIIGLMSAIALMAFAVTYMMGKGK